MDMATDMAMGMATDMVTAITDNMERKSMVMEKSRSPEDTV